MYAILANSYNIRDSQLPGLVSYIKIWTGRKLRFAGTWHCVVWPTGINILTMWRNMLTSSSGYMNTWVRKKQYRG